MKTLINSYDSLPVVHSKARKAVDTLRKPDLVAALCKAGTRGVPDCKHSCIVANYLQKQLGPSVVVYITEHHVEVTPTISLDCVTRPVVYREPLPAQAVLVVRHYDDMSLDKALYPKPECWTPEIGGYQYPIETVGVTLKATGGCPYDIYSGVTDKRLHGWVVYRRGTLGVRGGVGPHVYLKDAVAEAKRLGVIRES